jgi:hypothetical protein
VSIEEERPLFDWETDILENYVSFVIFLSRNKNFL